MKASVAERIPGQIAQMPMMGEEQHLCLLGQRAQDR
jgi:hypothetical protein